MKTFLLLGKTGVGKSSFVNSTFGKTVASCDPYRPCTKIARYFEKRTTYGRICLIDTPGLADGNDETDERYVKRIVRAVESISLDALVYMTRLDENRFRADEKATIQKLVAGLGSEYWTNVWLVFTHAASVPARNCDAIAWARRTQIERFLRKTARTNGFSFGGFRECYIVDNVCSDWHPRTRDMAYFLTK